MLYPETFPVAFVPRLSDRAGALPAPEAHALAQLRLAESEGPLPYGLPVLPTDTEADRAMLLEAWGAWDAHGHGEPPARGAWPAYSYAMLLELTAGVQLVLCDTGLVDAGIVPEDLPALIALYSLLDEVSEIYQSQREASGAVPGRLAAVLDAMSWAASRSPKARWGERPADLLHRLLEDFILPVNGRIHEIASHVRWQLARCEAAGVADAILDHLRRPTW